MGANLERDGLKSTDSVKCVHKSLIYCLRFVRKLSLSRWEKSLPRRNILPVLRALLLLLLLLLFIYLFFFFLLASWHQFTDDLRRQDAGFQHRA